MLIKIKFLHKHVSSSVQAEKREHFIERMIFYREEGIKC